MSQTVHGVQYVIVNNLAIPKHQKNECEMCGKQGNLQCPDCRVTYYCNAGHAEIDQIGIHRSVCPLLKELRTPVPVIGSERDRLKREHQREKIQLTVIETSKREAMKYLVANQFEYAMAGALQAQKNSIILFGADRVELVPAYLLLAEASMGLEEYGQAEGYLSKARYNVLEHPDCSNVLRSRLHRAWGRLMLVTGRVESARQELSEDIYYSSMEKGPDHVDTTAGYFHLANSFRLTKNNDAASRIYDKVINIWHTYLTHTLQRILERSAPKKAHGGGKKKHIIVDVDEEEDVLEDTQITEMIGTLTRILQYRDETGGSTSYDAGKTHRCLGLLLLYAGNGEEAGKELEKAYEIFKEIGGEESAECVGVKEEIELYL